MYTSSPASLHPSTPAHQSPPPWQQRRWTRRRLWRSPRPGRCSSGERPGPSASQTPQSLTQAVLVAASPAAAGDASPLSARRPPAGGVGVGPPPAPLLEAGAAANRAATSGSTARGEARAGANEPRRMRPPSAGASSASPKPHSHNQRRPSLPRPPQLRRRRQPPCMPRQGRTARRLP
eukprot:COSAG04_NODE_6041_length_1423_cov_7.344941_1_plen_177_part_10